jgi:hypothetical protein
MFRYRNFLSRYKEFALEPGRNIIVAHLYWTIGEQQRETRTRKKRREDGEAVSFFCSGASGRALVSP